MRVRCLFNSGEDLRPFEFKSLKKEQFGRFGSTAYTKFGGITVDSEYLVMGIIMYESYLAYLIDDGGLISAYPCQLFEVIDDKLNSNWHFRLIGKEDNSYPYIQAIWGYYELCFDKMAYENLIVENNEDAISIYFKRKMEFENG